MSNDERFNRAFEQMIKWEGGRCTNDPDDPGGLTKWGIDQRSHPNVDIYNLTKDEAREIYRREYWDRIRGNDIPSPLADVLFDIAVNNGVSRAVKWLQELLGVQVDGHIGPKTLGAIAQMDPSILALRLLHRRANFYSQIGQGRRAKFLRGWLNRNDDWRHYVAHFLLN